MDLTDRLKIAPRELADLLAGGAPLRLLDVREDWERAICALPGSVAAPMAGLPAMLATLDRGVPVITICHHGMRSLHAAHWLRANGVTATSLAGGVARWAREIDPAMATY